MESEPSAAGTRRATAPRGQRARLVASASAGVQRELDVGCPAVHRLLCYALPGRAYSVSRILRGIRIYLFSSRKRGKVWVKYLVHLECREDWALGSRLGPGRPLFVFPTPRGPCPKKVQVLEN